MPEVRTADGRILVAVDAAGDGNTIVYDLHLGIAVWNKLGYLAELGEAVTAPAPPVSAPPADLAPPAELETGGRGAIRVTDERDGELLPRMYSYWSAAWVARDGTAYVVAGHADGRPRFFAVHLASGRVDRLDLALPYGGTGEGWYWDAAGWIYLCDGPQLHRVNPFTGEDRVVFDISSTHPGCVLWQAHSSDDGRTHSATVARVISDGKYPSVGTVVLRDGRQEFFPAVGVLDESALTPDGAFLIIKEDDDNRIITLASRETRRLRDEDGALGHSDCGPGIMVGEANKPEPGSCCLWDLRQPLTPERRRVLFHTWNMGYVSVRGGRCVHSDDTHLNLVALDGSGVRPLLEHGSVNPTKDYNLRVKANLSPCSRVACYMSNVAGRLDVYLVVI